MKTNFVQKTLSFELKITIAERLHWGKIVKSIHDVYLIWYNNLKLNKETHKWSNSIELLNIDLLQIMSDIDLGNLAIFLVNGSIYKYRSKYPI